MEGDRRTAVSTLTPADMLEYYVNYFTHESNDRASMLNFFVIMEMALLAAMFTVSKMRYSVEGIGDLTNWRNLLAASMIFVAELFFQLDLRFSFLIHNCRKAIRETGKNVFPGGDPAGVVYMMNYQKAQTKNDQIDYSIALTLGYKGVETLGFSWLFYINGFQHSPFYIKAVYCIILGLLFTVLITYCLRIPGVIGLLRKMSNFLRGTEKEDRDDSNGSKE